MTDLEEEPGRHRPPFPGTVIIHSEFYRLLTSYEDAVAKFVSAAEKTPIDGPLLSDLYASMVARKREVHEWVSEKTPRPPIVYAMRHRF